MAPAPPPACRPTTLPLAVRSSCDSGVYWFTLTMTAPASGSTSGPRGNTPRTGGAGAQHDLLARDHGGRVVCPQVEFRSSRAVPARLSPRVRRDVQRERLPGSLLCQPDFGGNIVWQDQSLAAWTKDTADPHIPPSAWRSTGAPAPPNTPATTIRALLPCLYGLPGRYRLRIRPTTMCPVRGWRVAVQRLSLGGVCSRRRWTWWATGTTS